MHSVLSRKPLSSPVEEWRLSYQFEITVSPPNLRLQGPSCDMWTNFYSGNPKILSGPNPDFILLLELNLRNLELLIVQNCNYNNFYSSTRPRSPASSVPLLSSSACRNVAANNLVAGAASRSKISLRSCTMDLQNSLSETLYLWCKHLALTTGPYCFFSSFLKLRPSLLISPLTQRFLTGMEKRRLCLEAMTAWG